MRYSKLGKENDNTDFSITDFFKTGIFHNTSQKT